MTPRLVREVVSAEQVAEGLSRAVTAGIVTSWDAFADAVTGDWRLIVETADELRHLYTPEEASAFVDAIFAAERVWPVRVAG